MKIEEILKQAGIEDEETIKAIAAEVPKSFVPTDEMTKRLNAAKKEADEVSAQFEAYKSEVSEKAEEAAKKAAEDGDANATALEELRKQYDKLQGDFSASQTKLRETKAAEALRGAIKDAGANPAAIELLVSANLGAVTYSDDDAPENVADIVEEVKSANEGLFGVDVDTGKKQENGGGEGGKSDDFLAGFGDVTRR